MKDFSPCSTCMDEKPMSRAHRSKVHREGKVVLDLVPEMVPPTGSGMVRRLCGYVREGIRARAITRDTNYYLTHLLGEPIDELAQRRVGFSTEEPARILCF